MRWWGFSKKQKMSLGFLSLLLLLLLQLKAPSYYADDGNLSNGDSHRLKNGVKPISGVGLTARKSHHRIPKAATNLGGHVEEKKEDDIFGADKRRVRTGPNPLHNR
ncbi:unnamed protein product [Cuscuta epithymum]|uniref:Uncharacterized protein n=1 Tax=Cuscuta epithymum TaxID=186058 RepID=A0AAV0CM19_9ASTE|nr:unnamed protein product [Cuscuta epithymum]